MTTTAVGPERLKQVRRDEIRALVDNLRPGQWLSSDGVVRSGHVLGGDDAIRLSGPWVSGEPCERCGRALWAPTTRVVSKDRQGHEKLSDRLLCRACGHETNDTREINNV